MIAVKLQEIAHKLAKNSSEIARETGINRNTINALMHNKVDGLKFPTIEKICQTYGLNLADLIEYRAEPKATSDSADKMVMQRAPLALFYMWPWFTSLGNFPSEYFDYQYGAAFLYVKDGQAELYQPVDEYYRMASTYYRKYSDPKRLDAFMAAFQSVARAGEQLYLDNEEKRVSSMPKPELVEFFGKYQQILSRLWRISSFHESFEAGFERETIKQIARAKHLSDAEIIALTSMDRPSFHDERRLALINLVRTFLSGRKTDLEEFLANDRRSKEFQQNYGYYKNTMAGPVPQTMDELAQEMGKFIKDKAYLDQEYRKLADWTPEREKRVTKILKQHKLKSNPFAFFSRMAYLRERRKQVVSMLVSIGGWILTAVEAQTGMDRKYLGYLSHDELSGVLKGLVSQETLKERSENPLLIEASKDEYKLIMGAEADSVRQELEGKIGQDQTSFTMAGTAGSQGYAKGLARVIQSKIELLGLKEGEILVVNSMKQEYLDSVSKAAGFIVEDGDLGSLATKVARELGKPCLVNVTAATERISNGDLVDVRANHRSIKIIKK